MFNEPLYNNTNQIPLKELKVYIVKKTIRVFSMYLEFEIKLEWNNHITNQTSPINMFNAFLYPSRMTYGLLWKLKAIKANAKPLIKRFPPGRLIGIPLLFSIIYALSQPFDKQNKAISICRVGDSKSIETPAIIAGYLAIAK